MSVIADYLHEQGFSREQVSLTLKDWKIEPIICNGHQVGEIMMQNNEVHFALEKDFRLKMGRGKWLKRYLNELVRQHDFLVTKLFHGDKNKRLIEFMGFRKISEDKSGETFWLDGETINASN
jgi:hypothetical protein